MVEVKVIVWRPFKLLAFLFGLIALILLIMSVAGDVWLFAGDDVTTIEESLWQDCEPTGCDPWLDAVRALILISLIFCIAACVTTALGCWQAKTATRKWLFYKISIAIFVLAGVVGIIALIIFPVKTIETLQSRSFTSWSIGWPYGCGWGGVIFIIGATILLCIPIEVEEMSRTDNTKVAYVNNERIAHDNQAFYEETSNPHEQHHQPSQHYQRTHPPPAYQPDDTPHARASAPVLAHWPHS